MKNEQVVPNYKIMLETSVTLLALVASGWLLIKLIGACFWLPGYLKNWELEEASIEKLNEDSTQNEPSYTTKELEKSDSEAKKEK